LSGQIKINCHYYEKGNMQQSFNKKFDSIPVKNIASADDIVKAIDKTETEVSNTLYMFMLISICFDFIVSKEHRRCT